jgi:hypothetical protein
MLKNTYKVRLTLLSSGLLYILLHADSDVYTLKQHKDATFQQK